MDTNQTELHDLSVNNLARHCGYFIQVTLKDDGNIRNGYLYTIDPMTGNLILLRNDNQVTAFVIMNHAIDSIVVNPDLKMNIQDLDQLFNYTQDEYKSDAPWILERCDAFVAYLEKSRVPFRHELDDPVIHVLGRARVEPPYVATSVVCDNIIIRDRVREMIMNLF
ncbi:Gemin6 [Phascolomyces articulosus]|uniref:Gemin6 n=1 Tax=Phascolomyces articulosus TaxID=60185 RepID=A0AAD5JVV8_9FUNG|nr:Gemin6 [Phascolomyces articulosus]